MITKSPLSTPFSRTCFLELARAARATPPPPPELKPAGLVWGGSPTWLLSGCLLPRYPAPTGSSDRRPRKDLGGGGGSPRPCSAMGREWLEGCRWLWLLAVCPHCPYRDHIPVKGSRLHPVRIGPEPSNHPLPQHSHFWPDCLLLSSPEC